MVTPITHYERLAMDTILQCPVCGDALHKAEHALVCSSRHSFDIAKEGYVNLLMSGKPGDQKGDNKEMARSRRDFLNKGFYSTLAKAVSGCIGSLTRKGDNVLDICCGEGYYTEFAAKSHEREYYGFDISKNMVRLAAKRHCGASFFVANIASIPVKSESVALAFHLFAPFREDEFARVLKPGGTLVTAIPGKHHLYGLKEVLYPEPYYNDEKPPQADGMKLHDQIRVRAEINLSSSRDINALFQMTPYYYHTPTEGMKRLEQREALSTDIEFVLLMYQKS